MGQTSSKDTKPSSTDDGLKDEYMKKMEEYAVQHGMEGLADFVSANLNNWKKVSVNIGLTGESGVGKSSFINAIRGLKPKDPGAAKVNYVECTTDPEPYPFPGHENIKIWDLPGLGTPKFPKKTYLKDINIETYDFFVIITAGRFRDHDLYLAKEITKLGKPFAFVRSKIDIDIMNGLKDDPETNEEKIIEDIKGDIAGYMQEKYGLDRKTKIFVVSCQNSEKYDFLQLKEFLLESMPKIQKEALLFSIRGLSDKIIDEKAAAFRSRVWCTVAASGLVGAIPVPGVAAAFDVGVLYMWEIPFYQEQFGLNEKGLNYLADAYGVPVETLKTEMKFTLALLAPTKEAVTVFVYNLGTMASLEGLEALRVASLTFPIMGQVLASAVGAATSSAGTYYSLSKIIDMCSKDAKQVLATAMDKSPNK